MTDDMDIGALLVGEVDRRNKILDKVVFDQLQRLVEHHEDNNDLKDPTKWPASDLTADLLAYSPDFEDDKWLHEHNLQGLIASCQRWLDAKRRPAVG